jgi:hypothetical protein
MPLELELRHTFCPAQRQDSFVFANATAAGYTLALENHMLLIGGATVVSAHEVSTAGGML